jgi:hypothetical protein
VRHLSLLIYYNSRRPKTMHSGYNVFMPLTCNIDSRGKAARLIYGIVLVVLGLALAWIWAAGSGSTFRWIVTVLCMISGAVAIFEARAGWCVVRAMGIKTPM